MRVVSKFFDRLLNRRRRYDDLSASIQEHIDERTEELIAEGMTAKAGRAGGAAGVRQRDAYRRTQPGSLAVGGSGVHSRRPQADLAAVEKIAGIRDHRAADAGHRHRREYGGVQRAQQRAAAAAAVSGAGATGFAAPECAGRAGALAVSQRASFVGLDVSYFRRA